MKRGKLILILISLFITLVLLNQYEISFKDLKGEASYGTYAVSLTVVDLVNYNITYTEFSGATTNINTLTKSQQENISSLILEEINYGKITFNENINISSNISIDYALNISYNRIELNSSNLTNFNRSATLYLYNLTFSNPRILRDGEVCPSSICVKNSYSEGTLSFNVTHFTTYSSEETPSEIVPTGGAVSGGIGGVGGSTLGYREIHKPGKLFDMIIYIPEKYKKITGGEFLIAEMNIINLVSDKLVDINVDYWIEDLNKNIILRNTETRSILKKLEYLAKLQLPLNIKEGEYLLCAKIKGDDVALACNSFEIIKNLVSAKEENVLRRYIYLNLTILILIIILSIIYMYYLYRKIRKIEKIIQIDENNLRGGNLIKEKK